MKVLQINSFFTVGGPPRIMNGIYDTLKENGFECKIAAAREKMYVPEDSIRIGTDFSVKFNALKARVFDNEGFNAISATKKLIKQIEEYNPDIIHLHNLHGYYINVEILFDYLKKVQKPVVWTLHDCWPFTGHCAHFSVIGCKKWKTECNLCPQKREYPSTLFFAQSTINYAKKKKSFESITNMTIVTPSKWLSSFIPDSILKHYQLKVIHNGIDLNTFYYKESNILSEKGLCGKRIVLGVAQNWEERKGLEDFHELSRLLSDEYCIVLVGLTDSQKKNLPNNIFGVSRTNSISELVNWYSAAEVFVNLTYQDTFPTVNIEALACGTPVITYRTGGSPEAINESCGWVVEQGNVGAVKDVIANMNEKSEYQNAAVNRSKMFSRKARYHEYIDLYRSMVGEKR